MIPKVICQVCGGEIGRSDRFCSSCGTRVEWQDAPESSLSNSRGDKVPERSSTTGVCSMCGSYNLSDSTSCVSCGAVLTPTGRSTSSTKSIDAKTHSIPTSPLNFFQSWKLTL
ncbi:MAG: zinc ribbon domain-containing protein, partial [Ignavibacteriales bacterium]|nr:zinc ribbon domain-containing protein [Ignavibacteriales bacterium]